MHPYQHSLTSVSIWGGKPDDYRFIHDWLDATKIAYANFRHRALRHHENGIKAAEEIYGRVLKNSDDNEVPLRAVCEQHIKEDCGGTVPTLQSWLSGIRLEDWVRPISTENQAEESVRKWGGIVDDYLPIHRWMDAPHSAGDQLLALSHHSHGIFDAERAFGHVIQNSTGRAVPVRYVCELHVRRDCSGRIPTVADWLEGIPARSWMSRGGKLAGGAQ